MEEPADSDLKNNYFDLKDWALLTQARTAAT